MKLLHDRSFWIYCIVSFFFSVVGINYLFRNVSRAIWVSVMFLLAFVAYLSNNANFYALLLVLNIVWLGIASEQKRLLVIIAIIVISLFFIKKNAHIPSVQILLAAYIFGWICLAIPQAAY